MQWVVPAILFRLPVTLTSLNKDSIYCQVLPGWAFPFQSQDNCEGGPFIVYLPTPQGTKVQGLYHVNPYQEVRRGFTNLYYQHHAEHVSIQTIHWGRGRDIQESGRGRKISGRHNLYQSLCTSWWEHAPRDDKVDPVWAPKQDPPIPLKNQCTWLWVLIICLPRIGSLGLSPTIILRWWHLCLASCCVM
jgi:hypothetical protein